MPNGFEYHYDRGTQMRLFFYNVSNPWMNSGQAILRLTVALSVVVVEARGVDFGTWSPDTAAAYISLALAVLLALGIGTPLAALVSGGVFFWEAYWNVSQAAFLLVQGFNCVALAMIGPGRWSLDGLLFGRRRVQIPRR